MKNKNPAMINLLSTIVSFSLSILIMLFLTPYIVNTLGSEAYSFISISNNFLSLLTIIAVAVNSLSSRYISIEIVKKDYFSANRYYNSIFFSNIFLSVFIIFFSSILILYSDDILEIPVVIVNDVKFSLFIILLNFIVTLIGSTFAIATIVTNKLYLSSIKLISGNILRIIFLIVMYTFFTPYIFYFNISILIVTLYTVYSNYQFTKILLPNLKISYKFYDFITVKVILSKGIWNSITHSSNILLNQLDIILVNILVGALAGGEVSIIKVVISFLITFTSVITSIFIPKFLEHYSNNRFKYLKLDFVTSNDILILCLSIPIGFFMTNGTEFFKLWVPNENENNLNFFLFISMFAFITSLNANLIFNIYTIYGKQKVPSLFMSSFGVLKIIIIVVIDKIYNLDVNMILILSTTGSTLFYLLFIPIYTCKILSISYKIFVSYYSKLVLSILIVITLSSIVEIWLRIDTWSNLIFNLIVVGLASLIIVYLFVFSRKEKNNMINYFKSS